ncbi:MAG: DNA-binding response regulator [Balneola sp.]|nr:MAG: DNA-binding response regulator [Balneola sp.]
MNVLIIEDEFHTAGLLKEFIETNPGYLVVNICDSVSSSVNYLKNFSSNIDLIFMDVQLADGESFEIFSKVEFQIPVIFCTAFNEYILKAFKNNGIDYILKPVKETDIQSALLKMESLRKSLSKESIPETSQVLPQTILVRKMEKMIPIDISRIGFLHLYNETLNLYSLVGEKFTLFKTMDEMVSKLDQHQFYRINRQMIINRQAIKDIEPYFNRKVIVNFEFSTPKKAIVSRLKVSAFMEWLEHSNP